MFLKKLKIVLLLLALMGTGCLPTAEPEQRPTAVPELPGELEVVTDTLTVSPGLTGIALVTVPGGEKSWPTTQSFDDFVTDWSPNGRFLLFSSSRSGNSDLFTLDLETGETIQLTQSEQNDWNGRFSPDGSQIAYVSLTNPDQYQRQLFVMNSDGTNPRQLTEAEDNTEPHWSPDGRQILFHRNFHLWLADVASGDLTQIGNFTGEQQFVGWSPDGTELAFSSNHHDPQSAEFHLYRLNVATGETTTLVDDLGNISYAAWSPDGRFLAFTSNANSSHQDIYQLYLLDFASGETERISEEDAAHLAWSPDGEWIAFSSFVGNGRNILITRPDGSSTTPLTDGGEDEWGAVWSPDGTQIAFLSERVLTEVPPAQPVAQVNFTRVDLPTDLRPRGLGHRWYVGSTMNGSALYFVNLNSGERSKISDSGGWGDVVVQEAAVYWIDDDGHVQEYLIHSGQTRQLTTVASERLNLVGNGRWLAWQDKRNETGEENYYAADIYAYDLLNDAEVAVAVADGVQQQPAIWENRIVWSDNRNSPTRGEPLEGCGNCPDNPFGIYAYDLLTGETAVLVEDGLHNALPTISNGRVAWVTHDEGIRLMELARGVVETAVAYQNDLTQPSLFNDQLFYTIRQACDVMFVDESGSELASSTGVYHLNLRNRQTVQLTDYKEPSVLYSPASILIAEGCMTGFDAVYLLSDALPGSRATVSNSDPAITIRNWEYLGADSAAEMPPASDSVRDLDGLHHEIRLVQTTSGFDLIWSNFPCSTQPTLQISPDKTIEFWPGQIVGEDCEAMSVGHKIAVTLTEPVPLDAWQFIFHPPENEN